jgi:hypothetical protein
MDEKKATGGQSKESLSREEYPAWYAAAEALGGTVEPFDVYQGPYVQVPGEGRLFLDSEDAPVVAWWNEKTNNTSDAFDWEDENASVDAAISVLEHPPANTHLYGDELRREEKDKEFQGTVDTLLSDEDKAYLKEMHVLGKKLPVGVRRSAMDNKVPVEVTKSGMIREWADAVKAGAVKKLHGKYWVKSDDEELKKLVAKINSGLKVKTGAPKSKAWDDCQCTHYGCHHAKSECKGHAVRRPGERKSLCTICHRTMLKDSKKVKGLIDEIEAEAETLLKEEKKRKPTNKKKPERYWYSCQCQNDCKTHAPGECTNDSEHVRWISADKKAEVCKGCAKVIDGVEHNILGSRVLTVREIGYALVPATIEDARLLKDITDKSAFAQPELDDIRTRLAEHDIELSVVSQSMGVSAKLADMDEFRRVPDGALKRQWERVLVSRHWEKKSDPTKDAPFSFWTHFSDETDGGAVRLYARQWRVDSPNGGFKQGISAEGLRKAIDEFTPENEAECASNPIRPEKKTVGRIAKSTKGREHQH